MNTRIIIRYKDKSVIQDMFGHAEVAVNSEYTVEKDINVNILRNSSFRSPDATNIVEFLISWPVGVASGIIANWIYDKLKNKDVTLVIEQQEIEIDEEKIKVRITKIEQH